MRLQRIGRWLDRNPVKLGLSISGVLLFGLLLQEYFLQRFTVIRLLVTSGLIGVPDQSIGLRG